MPHLMPSSDIFRGIERDRGIKWVKTTILNQECIAILVLKKIFGAK